MYNFQRRIYHRNSVSRTEHIGWGGLFATFRIQILGMTQDEMADALGTHQVMLCRIENGKRLPPPDILEQFMNLMVDYGSKELDRAYRTEGKKLKKKPQPIEDDTQDVLEDTRELPAIDKGFFQQKRQEMEEYNRKKYG